MTEHMRTTNPHNGDVWQWVDSDRCMIIDVVTGEPLRFGPIDETTGEAASIGFASWAVGTFAEALAALRARHGWEHRLIIVRLSAIAAHRVQRGGAV